MMFLVFLLLILVLVMIFFGPPSRKDATRWALFVVAVVLVAILFTGWSGPTFR